MSAPRPVIASWADTGRFVGSPQRERQRDVVAVAEDLQAGIPVRPLLAAWLAGALVEYDRIVAGGGRADLHKLLGLSRPNYRVSCRRAIQRERDRAIRELAGSIPEERKSWPRARRVLELLLDHDQDAPPEVRGTLAVLRDGLLGKLPKSEKSIERIIKAPLDKFVSLVASKDTPPVKRRSRGNP